MGTTIFTTPTEAKRNARGPWCVVGNPNPANQPPRKALE